MNQAAVLGIVGGALVLAAVAGRKSGAKKPSGGKGSSGGGKVTGPVVESRYSGDLEGLSDNPVQRSAEILNLIRIGRFDAPFVRLETSKGPLRARLNVSGRALRVDGVRVSMNEADQQRAADALGAHLLTPFLVDEIWKQAKARLEPKPQVWYADGTMAKRGRVFDFDAIVSAEAAKKSPGDFDLVSGEGKDWVLDSFAWSKPSQATNYGWHRPSGEKYQPLGRVHNLAHTDYSQLSRFVSSVAEVSEDGGQTWRTASFEELLTSPTLFPLVSYERLPAARHPGVPGGVLV